ncbi:MAG: Slp family lipoprotein [Gammaproteobacteria bacterium]|nr:Slp family lipoprotein [Gammaproteobacteria bacterium]
MRKKLLLLAPLMLFISLLTGCVSTPDFDISQVDRTLTPQSVISEPAISLGKIALWGGTILDTHNLKDSTQIEVLAYPLNSSHKPMQEGQALGRFIIMQKGYLESANYSQGRLLTVLGSISKSQNGKIGESSYTYPVINAQQLHLWPLFDDQSNTSFHFGMGFRL